MKTIDQLKEALNCHVLDGEMPMELCDSACRTIDRMVNIIRRTAVIVDPDCPDIDAYVDGHCGLPEAVELKVKAENQALAREWERACDKYLNANTHYVTDIDKLIEGLESAVNRLEGVIHADIIRGMHAVIDEWRSYTQQRLVELSQRLNVGGDGEARAVPMSLPDQYEAITGECAKFSIGGADYHKVRYSRWLESRLAEEIKNQAQRGTNNE